MEILVARRILEDAPDSSGRKAVTAVHVSHPKGVPVADSSLRKHGAVDRSARESIPDLWPLGKVGSSKEIAGMSFC